MKARKYPPYHRIAVEAISRINELSRDFADGERMEVWAPLVIAAFQRSADAFQIYDNQFWYEPGFWMARSVRNSPTYGPLLFASFK